MKLFRAPVTANEPAGDGLFMLRIAVGDLSRDCRAGQFLHVRCAPADSVDPLLRRPISIYRAAEGELWLYYDAVGRGTRYLAGRRPGDELDVLGPLGQPFRLAAGAHHLLMVGGGIGLAPLVALAEEQLPHDRSVVLLAGFRTAARVLPAQYLPAQIEYIVATDDGSTGHPGVVTDLVADYLDWADQVFACGPTPMLQSLRRATGHARRPVQVSLEERMGCGMGVCLTCVLHTNHGLKRVCRDGPVFDLADLRELQWRAADRR